MNVNINRKDLFNILHLSFIHILANGYNGHIHFGFCCADLEMNLLTSVRFYGNVAMRPAEFDPDRLEYDLTRPSDNPIRFVFETIFEADDRFEFEVTYSGNPLRGVSLQSHPCANYVDVPPSNCSISISFHPRKRYRDDLRGNGKTYVFHVPELVLTTEERAACTHSSYREVEGECWGGASGSSQIEMLRMCNLCDKQLGSSFIHNN